MDSLLIFSYLILSAIGLRLFVRGLNGTTGSFANVNLISANFFSGWAWGLGFQLLSFQPTVNSLYSSSFSASGIFRKDQGLGFQLSYIFGIFLLTLLTISSLSIDWNILLVVGGLLYFQNFNSRLNWIGTLVLGLAIFAFGNQEFLFNINLALAKSNEVSVFHYLADNQVLVQLALFAAAAAMSFVFPSVFLVVVAAFLLRYSTLISIENWIFLVGGQIFGEMLMVVWNSRKLTSTARNNSCHLAISFLMAFFLLTIVCRFYSFDIFGRLYEPFVILGILFLLHIGCAKFPGIDKIVDLIAPVSSKKEMQALVFSHPLLRLAPGLGIAHLQNEIRKLAAMVQTMMELTGTQMTNDSRAAVAKIEKYETITDNIQSEVREYAGELMGAQLSARESNKIRILIRVTESLENIADHCRSICRSISVEADDDLQDDEKKVLADYFNPLNELYESVFPDLTASDILSSDESRHEIGRIKNEMSENQPVFADSYPRLVAIYMRYIMIVSRIENISEAKIFNGR